MKINYIKYHNYRCFENLTITFETTSQKNISLVLGMNGAGKTEMLFSFQWVLYGFDFKSMREKEETPYSLNSTLYRKLSTERHTPSIDCWVELSFTHKDIEYFIKRTETFRRENDKVVSNDKVEFSYTKSNGERTTPEKDKTIVKEMLSRIIPKSILEGITFDGERMKKLNVADQSKETIKNVISLVTNEKLFDLCSIELKDVRKNILSQRNAINRKLGNVSAEELEKEISNLEEMIEDFEYELIGIQKNQTKVESELEDISLRLTQLEEANNLEQQRKGLEKDLARAQKLLEQNTEAFYKRLSDGYALVTDQLVSDVKNSLENIDIPAGLTVEAVKNILKRPKCICGCEMTDDVKRVLTDMLSTLPPDNISSTILYMANQFEGEKSRAKKLLKEVFNNMRQSEYEVDRIKKDLSNISASLVENVSETVRELETRRAKLYQQKGRLEQDEERKIREQEQRKIRLKSAKKELTEVAGNDDLLSLLNEQQDVLDLFKNAIEKIGERNSELSLMSINDYLSRSYSLLSDDTGRRIYICQYDKKEKYRLLTYKKMDFDKKLVSWINGGQKRTLEQEGLSEREIAEKIILEGSAEGKSTGQSKINSLAFAKAILDYSNEDRTDDRLKVSHDYPFLIDSPFTELSGDNLINVGKYINTFASQIILMADENSYGEVKTLVSPYVKSTALLQKDKEKGISYIK